jgi:hypothetical protein
MFSLKKYLDLNLFKPSPDSGEVEDDQRRRSNIIATRVYIIILVLILLVIGVVMSLIKQTTIITVKYPTKEQFEALPKDAQCRCSRISPSYGKFTSVQVTFHQLCSSDFVSDRWFKAINSGSNSTYFYKRDFRTYGSAQFQALAGFCRLSKASIEQSIALFYLNTLLSPQVLSETVLRSQTQSSIVSFQSTAPNAFKGQLRLLNQMTTNNELMSGLQTHSFYRYHINPSSRIEHWLRGMSYTECNGYRCHCSVDQCNQILSGIYNVFGAPTPSNVGDMKFRIPGISAGCLPVNSILVSTLECFYDPICLNKLISYFPTTEKFAEMTVDEKSFYSPNSTVQSMVDNLMIEKWIINISYDAYYSQCAPSSCTYFKICRHSFVDVLIQLISLFASLILVLRLVIPAAIRFIQRLRVPTSTSRVPCK